MAKALFYFIFSTMKIILLAIFLVTTGLSCNILADKDKVIIVGNLKHTQIKKVFLTDSYNWEVLLDSCDVIDDKFMFRRKKVDFETYSIYYKDFEGNQHSIEFINRVLSTDSLKYFTNYFMLDTSIIEIMGDWRVHKNHYYDVNSGLESKALFRTQLMQFGYLNEGVSKRTSQFNEYLSIIKQYPNSNYLLKQIDANKSVLKKAELEAMLNLFSQQVLKESSTGRFLTTYLAKKIDKQNFQNFLLEDVTTKQNVLYDTTAKINMLIIWASWCGPCRQEIPFLKELNKLYSSKQVSMTSVSVDDEKALWYKALEEEKMNWKQLIVPQSKKEIFNTIFEIGSIPCILFLDGKGNLVSRIIGVDINSLEEYKKIINQHLK